MSDIENLIEEQGRAFEAFKKSNDEQFAEIKKGINDPVLADRITKIETSLDSAIEAKIAIEAALKAERAEREALDIKIGRMGLGGMPRESAERAVEIKSFNDTIGALNSQRRRAFTPLDGKEYDEYKAAASHYLREGKENLTPDEVKVLQVGSDPDGGYWVTPDLTGQVVKMVYETSEVRREASIQTISTDALEGFEDIGEAGTGYAGEQALSGDQTTPQIGKWRIEVFWLDTEPRTTQQVLDDAAVDVESWLANKVGNKMGRFENHEFVTGAAAYIRGFMLGYPQLQDSGSGVAWGSIGYAKTGANGDFAASDPIDNIIDLVGLLKNEYLANAKFFTRRSVITKMRKFKATTGELLWQPSLLAGTPETMLGYPIVRMEDMPALASGSYSLAFGDLRATYQIVDRQGMRVIRDALTLKPFVKFYTTKRTGGGVVNFESLKQLQFAA